VNFAQRERPALNHVWQKLKKSGIGSFSGSGGLSRPSKSGRSEAASSPALMAAPSARRPLPKVWFFRTDCFSKNNTQYPRASFRTLMPREMGYIGPYLPARGEYFRQGMINVLSPPRLHIA
jgi:hypothetical protein